MIIPITRSQFVRVSVSSVLEMCRGIFTSSLHGPGIPYPSVPYSPVQANPSFLAQFRPFDLIFHLPCEGSEQVETDNDNASAP